MGLIKAEAGTKKSGRLVTTPPEVVSGLGLEENQAEAARPRMSRRRQSDSHKLFFFLFFI